MTARKEAVFLSETSVIHAHYLVLHSLEPISSEIYESNTIRTAQYILFKIYFNITLPFLTLSKVTVFLCLRKYRVVKKYGEVDVRLYTFLSSALVGGDWSVPRPGRFIPSDRTSGAIWIWCGECNRAGLEFGEEKFVLILSENHHRNRSLVSVACIRQRIFSIRRCIQSI